jgi:hypothetical protein
MICLYDLPDIHFPPSRCNLFAIAYIYGAVATTHSICSLLGAVEGSYTGLHTRLRTESDGLDRGRELHHNWLGLMKEKSLYIARFDGSKKMVETVVILPIEKSSVALDFQGELHG